MSQKKYTLSLENYLETIYNLGGKSDGVHCVDIASALSVSKASVNRAVNTLCEMNLARQIKYSTIYLTEAGTARAIELDFRHSTVKEFFMRILDLDEETADREACLIEHVISSETVVRLKNFLDSAE